MGSKPPMRWISSTTIIDPEFYPIFSYTHRIHGAAIYGNIYHKYTPNVSIYTIHGSYGIKKTPFLWVKLKSPMASQPRTPHVVFIASGHRSLARSKTEGVEASSRSKRLAEASAVAVILDEIGQAKVHESHSPSKSLKLQLHITSYLFMDQDGTKNNVFSIIYIYICFNLSIMTYLLYIYIIVYNIRRKFRSETSDNMDSWKAEVRRVRREKIRRKKMQMREKVGKSRFTAFFQWFVAPEGRKVGSLKRRVRRHLARWEMKKCTPLWREAHFEVKMYKTHHSRTTFGSWDVEKVHAVVARSTFRSQNVQNTSASDHFWKLWCRKSARRCGAKHISKSKCTKHTILGPLLEVEMSKKCTPLWREAHFQVKMYKSPHARATFGGSDVEKASKKCTPLWREAHFKVKSVKNWGFWAFFEVQMSKK